MSAHHGAPSVSRPLVIALHCSGSGAGQWRKLEAALGDGIDLVAPEHYGTTGVGPWSGEKAFTLSDEAARTVALIDQVAGDVHLVGHSYGGGVALRAAIERPYRIASLSVYEPSAFSLLGWMGGAGAEALGEIRAVAGACAEGAITGNHAAAAARFVNYWNGQGSWENLRPELRRELIRWLPKAALDFHALFTEPTPISAYQRLRVPVLILRGEHAPAPTRLIAEALAGTFPACRLKTIAGAGHMGPVTHAEEVNGEIVSHVEFATAQLHDRRLPAA